MLTTFRGHRGKSIWAMAVDRQHHILVRTGASGELLSEVPCKQATGGGDCSIRVQTLKGTAQPSLLHSWQPPQHGGESASPSPRSVFLLNQTPLCLTDQGYRIISCWITSKMLYSARSLWAGQRCAKTSKVTWSEVCRDPQFSGYSVGALSPYGSGILALGNIAGSMKLMKLDENGEEEYYLDALLILMC